MRPGDERPFLIFRKTRGNRFTLPVLLGCIEAEGLAGNFSLLLADSLEGIIRKAGSRECVAAFSFMTPDLLQVREEVGRLRRTLPRNSVFLAGGAHATGDPEGTPQLGLR